ncbi:MAG: GNAT family N-acetyltransferase [Nitrospirales bacterium]|nr:GNAT family N-acetyltransferase [Nitrospirales bacterium]
MIIYTDQNHADIPRLLALFEQAPWARGRTADDIEHMLFHTDLMVLAWDDDSLVGCGRVLTDYVYRASIWDVIVDQTYRGQDIGTKIINHILTHPSLKRVELFWLCTRDKQNFYEALGFSTKEQTGMVWDRNKQPPISDPANP